jgi:DNA invertase Pin-like site-specific DNA recombinase
LEEELKSLRRLRGDLPGMIEHYRDIDHSAFRGARTRPGLQQLDDHRGSYRQVIVPKLSCFGRSVKELVKLFDLFDREGITLVLLDMNSDTSRGQGQLLRRIMAAFAEYESDVRDYTRANKSLRDLQGRPLNLGGPAPYGYRRVERSYEAHPDVLAAVQRRRGWRNHGAATRG